MARLSIILVLGLVCQLAFGQPEWRTIDGTNNNRNNPTWGSTHIKLTRDNINWYYEDGISAPLTSGLPSPRLVSNKLFNTVPANPLAAQGFSDMHTFWGQFLDHDITWSPELETDLLYISVPEEDKFFNPNGVANITMKFKRSRYDTTTGTSTNNPRAQINVLSSFIDGSMVYGVDETRANALRDLNSKGRMKTTVINGHVYPPLNTMGLPNANPNRFVPNDQQFVCGDARCNENPMLTALHTIFLREHNRLAEKFEREHPDWDGERIYQEARRWVGAFCQSITFNEYSLATTGKALPEYRGYDANTNPSIMGAFSSVAFRYGHSEVNQLIPRLDENRRPIPQGHLLFRDGYFNPPAWVKEGVEPMIRGSAAQHQQEVDLFYVSDIRNFLFGLPGAGGLDLAALTIQRGRDHGMPPYNALRAAYGLPPKGFDQISSNPAINNVFREVYGTIDKVDAFVAGLAEEKPTGAHVGELFREIIWEQYRRLRDGDRFYYRAADAGFTAEQITEIDGTRLSHIILRNSNIKALQCGILFMSNALDCGEVTATPNAGGAASVDLLGGSYNLAWQVSGDKITITMRAKTTGWVGFGIPEAPSRMVGSDAVVGWVDDGTGEVHVDDYFITDRAVGCPNGVCEDTQQGGNRDITDVSGTQENGVTTIKFTRPLAASDAALDRAIAVGSDQQIVFAFGNTDSLSYHGANRGGSAVNFASGGLTGGQEFKTIQKRIAHGTIMIFAWMVLLPLGIYFASFLKHLTSWFRVHVLLQTFGVLFAVAGLIIAVEFTAELNSPHFDGVHQAFGLTTLLIMICAPYLGYLSDMMFVPGRKATPVFPDKVHWTFGYVSSILAFPTIYLGLYAFGAPAYAYVLVGIWNGLMLVAYIVLSVFKAKGKIGQHFPIGGDHEMDNPSAYVKLNE